MKTFKRKAYSELLKWKQQRNGATALMLQGARRIGKSTLAEEFAAKEYRSYILVDFARVPRPVKDLFADMSNLDDFFMALQTFSHKRLYERQSVIIFDEVQLMPSARQAIKYLVKDGRYDYIETGSLISVKQSTVGIVIPSEETRVDMFPMDFEEFRWALGDEDTVELLRDAFQRRKPLGEAAHRQMMRDFRLYMLVGGMPQAVAEYLKTNSLAAVDLVKRDIISLYEDDLRKLDSTGRTSALFSAIPSQLGMNTSRYQVSKVVPGLRPSRLYETLGELTDAMTANVAYQVVDPNVGMALSRDVSRFKLFVADTGLFVTMAFHDREIADSRIYEKLLVDKLSANLGYIYENVVAQMLRAAGHQLYYHVMPMSSGKKYYEVDFLIADGYKISPIEVKSSGYKAHASLDAFAEKYSSRIMHKYLIYTKDLSVKADTIYIPVYMTQFL
jgi:hypothetical protein